MDTSSPPDDAGFLRSLAFLRRGFSKPLPDIAAACAELASIEEERTLAIAALLQRIMLGYYVDIRNQARWSLFMAIGAALLGTALFVTGFVNPVALKGRIPMQSWIVAGSIVMIIAAVCFFSYAGASRRLAVFYVGLERTNRFILADALCQRLGEGQSAVRARLVKAVAHASMLTLDGASRPVGEPASEGAHGPPPRDSSKFG
jgi:hypothetical protein